MLNDTFVKLPCMEDCFEEPGCWAPMLEPRGRTGTLALGVRAFGIGASGSWRTSHEESGEWCMLEEEAAPAMAPARAGAGGAAGAAAAPPLSRFPPLSRLNGLPNFRARNPPIPPPVAGGVGSTFAGGQSPSGGLCGADFALVPTRGRKPPSAAPSSAAPLKETAEVRRLRSATPTGGRDVAGASETLLRRSRGVVGALGDAAQVAEGRAAGGPLVAPVLTGGGGFPGMDVVLLRRCLGAVPMIDAAAAGAGAA